MGGGIVGIGDVGASLSLMGGWVGDGDKKCERSVRLCDNKLNEEILPFLISIDTWVKSRIGGRKR